MQISVHGRRCQVPEDLRHFAVEKMAHLAKYMSTIEAVEVEFSEDGKGHKSGVANQVHVTVQTPGPVFRSKVSSPDPRVGVDQALKRLERQVKEFKRMRSGKPAHPRPKTAVERADERWAEPSSDEESTDS